MSAYLVNPEQIGLLAAYAASGPRNSVIPAYRSLEDFDDAESCAANLATACLDSLKARYPNDKSGQRPGPAGISDSDYVINATAFAEYYSLLPGMVAAQSPVAIIKLAKCYAYQSCEVRNWNDCDARQQIDWIIDKALALLPYYDLVPRDYNDPQGTEALDGVGESASYAERVAALFGDQVRPVLLSSLVKKAGRI